MCERGDERDDDPTGEQLRSIDVYLPAALHADVERAWRAGGYASKDAFVRQALEEAHARVRDDDELTLDGPAKRNGDGRV